MRIHTTVALSQALFVALSPSVIGQVRDGFFGEETALPGLNTPYDELAPDLSSDGTRLYFRSTRPPGSQANHDLYVAVRHPGGDAFGLPIPLDELNNASVNSTSISADGLTLYFESENPNNGDRDIWVAERTELEDANGRIPFQEIYPLESVNSAYRDRFPNLSNDGLELFFVSARGGSGLDLYTTRRNDPFEGWPEPRRIGELSGPGDEKSPSISSDRLTLFWGARKGQVQSVFMATRPSIEADFGEPTLVLSGVSNIDIDSGWPAAGSKIYFARLWDLHEATWHPDCNGNGLDDLVEIERGDAEDADGDGILDECERAHFLRGDDNDDGVIDISDPVLNLEYQFLGLGEPGCLAALDTNADGITDISDPVYNLEHQFLGRPAPPPPYPDCGPESLPVDEALPCDAPARNCP